MPLEPLAGIRVLDFTALPPGAMCTVMLADLGAEIIRVEAPSQKGTPSLVVRQVALSRSKRSIALDMRHPSAVPVLERLIRSIDVVVENAKPGAMEARGFGYRQAQAINPGIIWCAVTGFGQDGPYAEYAGHDLSYLAHSGLLGALSPVLPWHPAMSLSLQAGSLSAVVGIQSALLQRAQSGDGGFIDVSLSEAATWLLTAGINPLSDSPYALAPTPDRRLYRCADGRFVAVACAEPRTWAALCDGLDQAELKGNLHDPANAEYTAEKLTSIFRTRPAAHWVGLLAPSGAAVTIVNHANQLLDDSHVQARASVLYVAGAPIPASPVRITGRDGRRTETALSPPHLVGQDTEDVLASAGFSPADIAALRDAAII